MKDKDTFTFKVEGQSFHALEPLEKRIVKLWRGELFTIGIQPSYKETSEALGIKKHQVSKLLNNLEKKGYFLRKEKGNIDFTDWAETGCGFNVTISAAPKIAEYRRTNVQRLEEILSRSANKGAFIHQDLHAARAVYGFKFNGKNSMYDLCAKLQKSGKAQIVKLYNHNSKSVNKLQLYVQLVK